MPNCPAFHPIATGFIYGVKLLLLIYMEILQALSSNEEKARKVFGNVSEFNTLKELEEIISNHPRSNNHIRTQALLVIQRVMREINPHPIPYVSFNLLRYGASLIANRLYAKAMDVAMLSVEALGAIEWEDAVNAVWPTQVFNEFLSMLETCLKKQLYPEQQNLPNQLHFGLIMEAFRFLSSSHSKILIQRCANFSVHSKQIIIKMASCIKKLSMKELKLYKKWLSEYIALIECHPHVYTLLHEACYGDSVDHEMVKFLLDAGSCPFATDEFGNSALHYLSQGMTFNGTAVQKLLNAGAHLDQANTRGFTPLMNFKQLQLKLANDPIPYLDSLCSTFLPLQCLCAQVIRKKRIPSDNLPRILKDLVEKH